MYTGVCVCVYMYIYIYMHTLFYMHTASVHVQRRARRELGRLAEDEGAGADHLGYIILKLGER